MDAYGMGIGHQYIQARLNLLRDAIESAEPTLPPRRLAERQTHLVQMANDLLIMTDATLLQDIILKSKTRGDKRRQEETRGENG